jgi:hypothetical protein
MYKALITVLLFTCLVSRAQILNAYAKVSSISGTFLTVTNVNQTSHTFNTGEKVLIMQMQDNVIGTNTVTTSAAFGNLSAIANAGRYEFALITARSPAAGTPTSITVATALVNSYNTGVNCSVQLVTFRNMGTNYSTSANITGLAWNGNVGGIICFEVSNTLTLQNNISADGIGFIGGLRNPNFYSACENTTYAAIIGNRYAGKGEGIYNTTSTALEGARGKIINGGGGGNDVNGGGGGGGNYSTGGDGGIGWVTAGTGCVPTVGGVGGISLSGHISATRVFMGGGGGSGHQNDGVGSDGGNGGGIILIKATRLVSGSCAGISITANGIASANAVNDGAGGGGAAGSIILQIPTFSVTGACPLTIAARGGNGGSSVTTGVHGGGAGGGQGVIIFSSPQPTLNVTATTAPGTAGTSCAGCPGTSNPTNGAGPNNAGVISSVSGPLPIELLNFDGELQTDRTRLFWSTSSELNNDYYVVERSDDASHFKNIGTLKAAGNTRTVTNYELYDSHPLNGINYYRLKQVDTDDKFNYSGMVAFSFDYDLDFTLFPNPSGTDKPVYITIGKSHSTFVEVTVYDITGNLIASQQLTSSPETPVKLGTTGLAKGIYMIRLVTGTGSLVKKLVIN